MSEHYVTCGVTKAVIDVLESVNVNKENRWPVVCQPGTLQRI